MSSSLRDKLPAQDSILGKVWNAKRVEVRTEMIGREDESNLHILASKIPALKEAKRMSVDEATREGRRAGTHEAS